ncbi:hypothetical protein T440DRAFT_557126 [Plenodomus tracheiphilus IPT5]|uniref:DUF7730 domain-containing protein n=1 Tax=Plenodomus tracheiphilus IPT5 TaxID=1408161 RepID=A0A6A7B0E0_9PLEO|nr:hypothetical protein T440DRAFT_557126 [Plenodomus tracheiphilus IPT5]
MRSRYKEKLSEEKRLTKEEADAMSLTNQQTSPFLRLPAEVRNRIYSLVLGHHIIFSMRGQCFISRCSMTETRLAKRVEWQCPAHYQTPKCTIGVSAVFGLLKVSRQINVDCKLLPFELNEFSVFTTHMKAFRMRVNDEQWKSIATFRISQEDVRSRCSGPGHNLTCPTRRPDWDEEDDNIDRWYKGIPYSARWSTAIGLQRVIVEGWCPHDDEDTNGRLQKQYVIEKVKSFAGDRDIEVIFKVLD